MAEPGQTHGCHAKGYTFFATVPVYWGNPWVLGNYNVRCVGQGVSALSAKGGSAACLRWTTFAHLGGLVGFPSQKLTPGEIHRSFAANGQGHRESQLPLDLQSNTLPEQHKDMAFLQGRVALG